MAELLEKNWIGLRIVNEITIKEIYGSSEEDSVIPKVVGTKPEDRYIAAVTYGGNKEIVPIGMMGDITYGKINDSPTAAVYDTIKVLKEFTMGAFEAAKARGLLAGLSFEDIK